MGCAEGIDGMEGKGGSGGTDCMTCVGAGIRCCPYAPGMTVVAEVGFMPVWMYCVPVEVMDVSWL